MNDLTPEKSAELRKAFPEKVVGTLPKPTRKDAPKGQCRECGGYHGLPAVHLDYVGHAAVTDRLLSVDPLWSWEPLALDDHGLPALDKAGNLWIRLTVCGHTRIGVGDGSSAKEAIGDALRNAAMRFGVALDLWSKEELESEIPAPHQDQPKSEPQRLPAQTIETGELRTDAQSRHMFALLNEVGLGERDAARAHIAKIIGHEIESTKDLTKVEASKVIEALTRDAKKREGGEDPWGPPNQLEES